MWHQSKVGHPHKRMKVNYMGNMRQCSTTATISTGSRRLCRIVPPVGIEVPLEPRRPLVKITSCRDFFIEPLTHFGAISGAWGRRCDP